MLYAMISQSGDVGVTVMRWIEIAALVIEVAAVLIIIVPVLYNLFRYLFQRLRRVVAGDAYRDLKGRLGRSMLLGLELLVAADIVRTVALETTLESVGVLGLLVLIRTFLSWALEVEIEGRCPGSAVRSRSNVRPSITPHKPTLPCKA
jgi:uncharacterized membrane protein